MKTKNVTISEPSTSSKHSFPRLCAWVFPVLLAFAIIAPVSPGIGLLLGIAFSLLLGNPFQDGTHRWAQRLLQWSVIGLGADIQLGMIWKVGVHGAGLTVLSVGLTLALGLWLGRKNALSGELSLLLAAGTAICGGSAIAALSSVMKPRKENLSAALATIFLLNAVALFAFPAIGHLLHFNQEQFGLWSALAIHDTSSVVGAAVQYGHKALIIATTVKLTRALWILPLAVGISMMRPAEVANGERRKLPIPFFIFGFLGIAAIFSAFPALTKLGALTAMSAHHLLTGAIFLIGACLSKEAIRKTGHRPLLTGLILWLIVASLSAVGLKFGWIHLS